MRRRILHDKITLVESSAWFEKMSRIIAKKGAILIMAEEESKKLITQEDILKLLDACYEKSLNGIPKVSESVEELANDYLKKHESREDACKAMMRNQIAKCTTSGFLTGFGGIITLPISLPANITSVIYVQMRMIGCAARLFDYDLASDQTRTFVYACLAGVSVNQVVKKFGVQFGNKLAVGMVKKIPGKTLTKINQKVGFRFLTKFGEKGLLNLGKAVPVVGAIIGGGLDLVETKVIANRAYKWFAEGDFSDNEDENEVEEAVVDTEPLETETSEETGE